MKSFIIILFLFILSSCSNNKLSYFYIENTKWEPQIGELGLQVSFKNKKFQASGNYEGGDIILGTYKIKKDILELKIEENNAIDNLQKDSILQYKLIIDNNSLYYKKYLKLINKDYNVLNRFWDINSKIESNTEMTIDNISVISYQKKSKFKELTIFYTKPNLNSKKYKFTLFDPDSKNNSSNYYITKPDYRGENDDFGTFVKLIAKSKDKINNEYWYYSNLPIWHGGYDIVTIEEKPLKYFDKVRCWIKESDLKK